MENKIVKITPPEGYEVDEDKSTFKEIVFKKIGGEYPKSWEECLYQNRYHYYIDTCSKISDSSTIDSSYINKYYNSLPNKESSEQVLALCQLLLIKDIYNEGISTDDIPEGKMMWGLHVEQNQNIIIYFTDLHYSVLIFYKEKAAREFLKNFKDLILKAAPLL